MNWKLFWTAFFRYFSQFCIKKTGFRVPFLRDFMVRIWFFSGIFLVIFTIMVIGSPPHEHDNFLIANASNRMCEYWISSSLAQKYTKIDCISMHKTKANTINGFVYFPKLYAHRINGVVVFFSLHWIFYFVLQRGKKRSFAIILIVWAEKSKTI